MPNFRELHGRDAEEAYAAISGGRVSGGLGDRGVDVHLPSTAWTTAACCGFQVKSSVAGVLEHVRRCLANGGFIPVVCGDAPGKGQPLPARRAKLFSELSACRVWVSAAEKRADPEGYEQLMAMMPRLLETPLASHVALPVARPAAPRRPSIIRPRQALVAG